MSTAEQVNRIEGVAAPSDPTDARLTRSPKVWTAAILILVFVVDTLLPRGIAAGVPYIVAVLVSMRIPGGSSTIVTAAAASCLTVLGAYLSPAEPINVPTTVAANRFLSIAAIWSVAILGGAVRRSNIAARSQTARVEAILQTAVEAIITIDESGRIDAFNQAAERIFGYSASEVAGKNIRILMPSPYRDEHDGYLDRYLRTGERRIIGIGREVTAQRKNGSVFPADISVSEFWLEGRRMFTGIVRDISERKHLQERTLQAERLAGIGQMAAGVAHESRNALQRIRARTEMLEMDMEDRPSAIEDLHAIQAATDDINELLEEVRAYAGPIRLETQPFDIRRTWQLAWSNLADKRKDRDVQLDDSSAVPCDRLCELDPFRLEQVFRNLLENSLAACPDPVRIKIACQTIECGGEPGLQISVADNGPGLGSEVRERVFEAFYTTKTKGTGLGLAIVRRIVEAHGGFITTAAKSTQGGAEFLMTLPKRFAGARRPAV